jgi:hypothetical protein
MNKMTASIFDTAGSKVLRRSCDIWWSDDGDYEDLLSYGIQAVQSGSSLLTTVHYTEKANF